MIFIKKNYKINYNEDVLSKISVRERNKEKGERKKYVRADGFGQ